MRIEISQEAVDDIVLDRLQEDLAQIQNDLRARKKGELTHGIFHSNKSRDIDELKCLLLSLETVINYYSVPSE